MKFPGLLMVVGLILCPGCERARTLVGNLGKPKTTPHAPVAVELVTDLREADVGSFCRQRGRLTILEYYADWNGQSMQLVPIFQRITKEYDGRVLVGKLSVDKAGPFAAAQGVKNLPDVRFYSDGVLVDRFVGLPDDREIQERIEAQVRKLPAPSTPPAPGKASTVPKPVAQPMKKDWLPEGMKRR